MRNIENNFLRKMSVTYSGYCSLDRMPAVQFVNRRNVPKKKCRPSLLGNSLFRLVYSPCYSGVALEINGCHFILPGKTASVFIPRYNCNLGYMYI